MPNTLLTFSSLVVGKVESEPLAKKMEKKITNCKGDVVMSNKLNMTEAQIERQGQKIMDVLFTDIVEETDSGYTAEINPKVINLFKSEIPLMKP